MGVGGGCDIYSTKTDSDDVDDENGDEDDDGFL